MASRWDNKSMLERFEEKFEPVTESGCWIWTASVHGRGYGLFHTGLQRRRGKMEYAHRVSYELYHGVDPADEEVCHKCDVTSCVNPSHLFLGSHQDNMDDMRDKDRFLNSKERIDTEGQEQAIALRAKGYKMREIGDILGVSESHASRLSRGLRKHFNKETQ
jgi:DNA-directed RNA polymerase specialized sigma subunit